MHEDSRRDIDWDALDKRKFFVYGTGLFSAVTVCLFPLTVIKTRQIASDAQGQGSVQGLRGAARIARDVFQAEGIRGLYKGFGTVLVGTIPARIVYLTSLEKVRAVSSAHLHAWGGLSDAASAGAASFVAGFCASLATQAVSVPIDVVSQRLMIADRVERSYEAGASHVHAPHEGPKPRYAGGLQAFRAILAQEGLRGLYRGLPVSLLTYAPSSAIWWSAYSTYQKLLWHALGLSSSGDGGGGASVPWVGAVQVASGVAAGATSGFLTAPLDVVKTRLQVTRAARGEAQPTVRAVVRDLFARDGLRGMFRGVAPRMASSALWGTAMVSAYEFLKRVCAKETSDAAG